MVSRIFSPVPGSAVARRVALIRFIAPVLLKQLRNALLWLVPVIAYYHWKNRDADSVYFILIALVMQSGAPSIHKNPGTEEWLALIPGGRREKFHTCFFGSAALPVLIIACAGAGCFFSGKAAAWTPHLVTAMIWIPLSILAAGFTRIVFDFAVVFILGVCALVIAVGVGFFLINHSDVASTGLILAHIVFGGGILTWLFRRAREDFLTGEFRLAVPEAETAEDIWISETGRRTPMPAPHRTPASATLAPERSQAVTVLRKTTVRTFASVPAKQRRAALYRLIYGGAHNRMRWAAGIWFVSLSLLPALGQMFIHLLFELFFFEYVLLRRWRFAGSADYALLLPVSRREFLWLRVWPMLALTVFMAFAGLFFSQVVDIWDAHARYSDFLLPSVLAGPAVFCIFGVPALIWPGRVTGLFSWAWVVWIFGSKWADKFHFTTTDLAAGVFVLMTLAVGISFWAVGRRQSPGVTGA